MRRSCLLAILSLICWPALGANPKWYVMTRESGCQPLQELAAELPGVSDSDTPEKVLAAFRHRWPDATLRPYTDVLAEQHGAHGNVPDADERRALSAFTPENAFWLSSTQGDVQLLLLTEDVCRRMRQLFDH